MGPIKVMKRERRVHRVAYSIYVIRSALARNKTSAPNEEKIKKKKERKKMSERKRNAHSPHTHSDYSMYI
jgi:hypothetical protein